MKHYLKGRNSVKRVKKDGLYREIKLLCEFCDLKDDCGSRSRKESYEKAGFITRCPFTPNGRKKKKAR